jgi:hypothetical protein
MPRQLQTDDVTFWVSEADLDEIPEPDAEVRYELRELTTAGWRRLHKAHTKRVPNKSTKQMESVTDQEAFADALVDYVLVGWSGIVERGGTPAPCTTENKLRLDSLVKAALVGRAGLTQIVQADDYREQSFRSPDDVG